jgi:lysophospholipase L1-like esterase
MKPIKLALTAAVFLGAATGALAAEAGQWAGVWGFPIVTLGPAPAAAAPPAAPAPAAAAPAPRPAGSPYNNSTVRQIVRLTSGGDAVRVRLSNEFGATGMRIGSAHIALVDARGVIVPGTDRTLTFGGAAAVTIPPFAPMISDSVPIKVAPLQSVAVSLYLPEDTRPPAHRLPVTVAPGDQTAAAELTGATLGRQGAIVTQVDVKAAAHKAVIVAFGDSITEGGVASTAIKYNSWPDALADRIAASPYAGKISVVNAGISGNRLLREGSGPAALARFDRDVCSVPGATHVILLEGINDIGNGHRRPPEDPTIEELIGSYRQIIARSHDCGLKIYGATLTPYEGANYYDPAGEAKRQALNTYIRTSGEFDGVVDFEKATRDPTAPTKWLTAVQNGDNLHPNVAGYEAMAKAIDLKMFGVK